MIFLEYLKKYIEQHHNKQHIRYDEKKYLRYCSNSISNKDTLTYYEREIMVLCHTIEKGLSHKKIKEGFAKDRIELIKRYLDKYIALGGNNKYIVSLANSAILEWYNVNLSNNPDFKIDEMVVDDTPLEIQVGTKEITEEEYFHSALDRFDVLAKSRRSIRLYDAQSEEIQREVLNKAIDLALYCPNACNRQATRVKVILNKKLIKELCDIQGGANQFGEKSGALIIVSADLRYYMLSERRLPMLDNGIFVMNLVDSLYFYKYGTCILNGSFSENQESKIKKIVNIPEYEMISAFIAVSKISANDTIKVANSCRKRFEEIVTVLE